MVSETVRRARSDAKMTQEELGRCSGLSQDIISRIERDVWTPTPEQGVAITRATGEREVLRELCRACPVHKEIEDRFVVPSLDGVDLAPANVATRAAEEALEAAEALGGLAKIFNRLDWVIQWDADPELRERVIDLCTQVEDLPVAISTLYRVMNALLPDTFLREVRRRQREKLVARGYCRCQPTGTEG